MRATEIRAVGDLLGGGFAGTVRFAQDMHRAIAARAFRGVGPLAVPVRVVHDRVSRSAYSTVRAGLRALPRGGAEGVARSAPDGTASMADSPRGSLALGALNGVIGDRLRGSGSELALTMTVRERGRVVATDRAALARAFPRAGSRLAVFVHGLCETERAWSLAPVGARPQRPSYGSRLRDELGYTPLYVRYNTGLHISDNGRQLSELLEEIVAAWPAPVEQIAFVGHSMGGLVARSACHCGDAAGARWTRSVRHVFCLGSPHLGAPLEKAANAVGYALARVSETRALATFVNGRSAGIKDLRFGSCAEEDWRGCDADEFLKDRCREVPFLDCASYYFIGATVSRTATNPLGALVGDLLVRFPSAAGRGRRRRIPFELENGRHLGGLNHFDLLNHPAVYEQVREWLAAREAGSVEASVG